MTTVPAIKGLIGDKLYYQCTMNAKDLIARTEAVEEYFSEDDIKEQGEKGTLQRKLNSRYLTEVAPYLLRNKDRFIPSIVVNLDTELCEFSSLEDFTVSVEGKMHRVKDSINLITEIKHQILGFFTLKMLEVCIYLMVSIGWLLIEQL